MTKSAVDGDDLPTVLCNLTWRIVRQHGWSKRTSVAQLARNSNYNDEKAARDVIRNELSKKSFMGFHKGKDQVWVRKQDKDELKKYLQNSCGYSKMRIDAKLDSEK